MAGSAFLLLGAGGTHPRTALQLPNALPASVGLSFPQAAQITLLRAELAWWMELHINQCKPKWPEAMASLQHHHFLYWDGNGLSQAYQPPHRGSLTGFVWKEVEEGKEKCGENSDLKWQSLDWRSSPTETITLLKNHRSWIKTFLPSSKATTNLPSHSVSLSILTEQPTDQESLLPQNIWAPRCGKTFQAYGDGCQYVFWEAGKKNAPLSLWNFLSIQPI